MGMDALTRCKAMEAFCRQRAKMESEAAGFWLNEAQVWGDRRTALTGKPKPKLAVVVPAPKVRRSAS
jgi:hypothetical protein